MFKFETRQLAGLEREIENAGVVLDALGHVSMLFA